MPLMTAKALPLASVKSPPAPEVVVSVLVPIVGMVMLSTEPTPRVMAPRLTVSDAAPTVLASASWPLRAALIVRPLLLCTAEPVAGAVTVKVPPFNTTADDDERMLLGGLA